MKLEDVIIAKSKVKDAIHHMADTFPPEETVGFFSFLELAEVPENFANEVNEEAANSIAYHLYMAYAAYLNGRVIYDPT